MLLNRQKRLSSEGSNQVKMCPGEKFCLNCEEGQFLINIVLTLLSGLHWVCIKTSHTLANYMYDRQHVLCKSPKKINGLEDINDLLVVTVVFAKQNFIPTL